MSKIPHPSYAFFVGIDWASTKHDVEVVDEHGKASRCEIEHSSEAIDAWLSQLLERASGRPIAIILEQSKGALIHTLMFRENVFLYPLNPSQLANYRGSFQTTKAKCDRTDAALLARFLFERHRELRPWKPDDDATRLLSRLAQSRRQWVDDRTQVAQRLLDQLKAYFPAVLALAACRLYECPLLLELLCRWPDPRVLKRVHPSSLKKLFAKFGYRNPERQQELLEAIRSPKLFTADETLITVAAINATGLAKQIQSIQETIEYLDGQLEKALANHADSALYKNIRGMGTALTPRVIAAFGSDRERFQNAEQVASYCGVAPVTKQSGKSRHVVRRRACSKYLLQTFHEFAASASIWSYWSKAFYRLQLSKGMKRHAALRKLAYKWIRILFRVWKTRIPFDEQRYVESLSVKNPEIIPFLRAIPSPPKMTA